MNTLVICKTESWEEIAPLMKILQTMHADARPDIYRPFDEAAAKAEFLSAVRRKEDLFLAARIGEETAGYLHLTVHHCPTGIQHQGRKILRIEELGVFPKFRRQGIGSGLIEEARKIAVKENCGSMELCVWNFNEEAYRFYKKQGFSVQRRVLEAGLTKKSGGSN